LALHDHRIRFLRRSENEKTDMHFAGIIERNHRYVNNNSSVGRNIAERRWRGDVLGDRSFPSMMLTFCGTESNLGANQADKHPLIPAVP